MAASEKRNYQREMEQILESLGGAAPEFCGGTVAGSSAPFEAVPGSSAPDASGEPAPKKPTLLLHACCGPCSSYCLETLVPYFDITIYYYNPNISPQQEYARRLSELEKFLTRFPAALSGGVKLVEAAYDPEDFFMATNVRNEPELAAEPERGERCRRCYELRMKKSYEYACANGFDWFTTTLSISPHKDAEKINTIGFALEARTHEVAQTKATRFLPSDFKKKNGFLRSTQITEEYGMWRQDYCGCIYSMRKGL
jgi:predicted adenine nucleotide alpha hydrolase (AANH) superfamily ATPase